jgi:hypothetical protein
MSSVIIAGNVSGTITLDAPNIAGTTTLTLPTTSGTIVTTNTMPTGSVLQVVTATKTDTASYATNGSWTDLVGISASITPSSTSNKVLILVSISSGCSGANSPDSLVRLKRGGSVVTGAIGDAAGSRTQGSFSLNTWRSSYELGNGSFQYLDSPSSTSSLTYGFDIKTGDTGFINRTHADENGTGGERGISVITLMEIKG